MKRLNIVAILLLFACGAWGMGFGGGGGKNAATATRALSVESPQTSVPQGITLMGSTGSGGIRLEVPATFSGMTTAYQMTLTGWKRCKWNGQNEPNSVLSDCVDYAGAGDGGTFATLSGEPADNTALAAALNLKAPIDSPALTGTPTVPTPASDDDSTRVPNTGWVLDRLVGASSGGTEILSAAATLQSGYSYNNTTHETHTAPTLAANKIFNVFANTTSASIKADAASVYFVDPSGSTTTAGYSIRIPKGASYTFKGYAANNTWYAFKEIGSNLVQDTLVYSAEPVLFRQVTTYASAATCASTSTQAICGQLLASSAPNITKVDLYVYSKTGTITGDTFRVGVYDRTGNDVAVPAVAYSDTVSGATIAALTLPAWVSFTFASPVSMSAGQVFALEPSYVGSSRYIAIGRNPSADQDSGFSMYGLWGSTGVLNQTVSYSDFMYKLWQ